MSPFSSGQHSLLTSATFTHSSSHAPVGLRLFPLRESSFSLMIPTFLWMLAVLGAGLSRHTAPPYLVSDEPPPSAKTLFPPRQKESATHRTVVDKPSESATVSSTENGEFVNKQETPPRHVDFHDASSSTMSPKAPVRNTNRDPRKLPKDIYTRLAATEDAIAIPARGRIPIRDQPEIDDTVVGDVLLNFRENDKLRSDSRPEDKDTGIFVTVSNEDPVIISNKVLVTPRQSLRRSDEELLITNSSFVQNRLPVGLSVSTDDSILDAIVKHEIEKTFLPEEHLVQKLIPQTARDNEAAISLPSYFAQETFHAVQKDQLNTTAANNLNSNRKNMHGSSKDSPIAKPEHGLAEDSSLTENLGSDDSIVSPLGEAQNEGDSDEDTSIHSITNEARSLALSDFPSLNVLVPQEKKVTETNGTEDLHVVMPSLKGKYLPKSYDLKYVEIKDKVRSSADDDSSSTYESVPVTVQVRDVTTTQPLRGDETLSVMEKWKKLERKIRIQSNSLLKKMLPKILEHSGRSNVTSGCTKAMIQLISGLRAMKSWAVKMADASGKFPSGSLEGTLTDFGDYDECLDIKKPSKRGDDLRGQYCTVELRPLLPPITRNVTLNSKVLDFGNASTDTVFSDLSDASALFHIMLLRIGLCVPSRCLDSDIDQLISMAFQDVPVEVSVPRCEVKQPTEFSVTQIVIISMMASVGLLVCVGTANDVFMRRRLAKGLELGRMNQSLCAFSLVSNITQLLGTPSHSSRLGAVNGVRCLSLAWIILAHTYGFGHRQGLARLTDARHYMKDITFQIITNGWLSVDTFFMLGGLLVANSTLKTMEKTGGKINFIPYALHRIWRLTPPIVAVVGIMFLLPLIGSGPLWPDMVGKKVANCEQRWWQAILPINAWLDFDSACLLHTWYVSADIHFYCLAPVALVALYRWPALGYMTLVLVTSTCSLITGLLTIFYYLPPTIIFFSPNIEMTKRTANLIYFRPYPHMGAYCVGLALGYILWKHQKITINRILQALGWCLSITSCFAVLLATYPWSQGQMPNPVAGVVYAVVHRTVWAVGVAWLLFMCATKRAGILNKFLSWNLFTPLSRLCYSVYLLHFPVLWVRVSWRRTLLNFHHYDIVTEFFGILMVTLCLSIIFYLVFEVPFLNLENIWFPRSHQKKKNADTKQKI